MSAPKWTKWPWSEHGQGGCECGQIFGADGNAVVAIAQGPMHLGLDGPDCVPNRQAQRANAALIAAAPELYDALHRAYACLVSLIPMVEDGNPRDHSVLKRVKATLAKARGETP